MSTPRLLNMDDHYAIPKKDYNDLKEEISKLQAQIETVKQWTNGMRYDEIPKSVLDAL